MNKLEAALLTGLMGLAICLTLWAWLFDKPNQFQITVFAWLLVGILLVVLTGRSTKI